MRGGTSNGNGAHHHEEVHGVQDDASFQIVVLGATGGPLEDSVTGVLVRAPQSEWRKNSVIAVDAGAHLANIVRILEKDMPRESREVPPTGHPTTLGKGPFAGLRFPHISAKANGLYFFRELLHSFLITHPHLDHVSGMSINTPALEYGREPKAIVALPSTIEAVKTHIFNDSIWPNLSDEGHGVGFVTYRRLIEGGNPRLGSGPSRGYVNVCDGLATKCWSVSHGKCHVRHGSMSQQRRDSFGWAHPDYGFQTRRLSRISDDHGYFAAVAAQQGHTASIMPTVPVHGFSSTAVTPGIPGLPNTASTMDKDHMFEPVSSSAFFIRNDATGKEILIFGDIEPDSVSMSPRNHIVWNDAAPKIVEGDLKAIFIECSYADYVRNEDLYGHLCPRHLVAELVFLANAVLKAREDLEKIVALGSHDGMPSPMFNLKMGQPPTSADMKKKRKRGLQDETAIVEEVDSHHSSRAKTPEHAQSPYVGSRSASGKSRRKASSSSIGTDAQAMDSRRSSRHVQFTGQASALGPPATPRHHQASQDPEPKPKLQNALQGLTVHIIHVKDTLEDGPTAAETIIKQLRMMGDEAGLGCEFNITTSGMSIWV